MDKFESLQIIVGRMVDASQEEECDDPTYAKKEFDKFVSDLVDGKKADWPEGPIVRRLFLCSKTHGDINDRLKPKTAKLLGLTEKTTYSEAVLHCLFCYKRNLEQWVAPGQKGYVENWQENYANVTA